MQFDYSLTREEFDTATTKYFKKVMFSQIILCVVVAFAFLLSLIMIFVNKFVTHEPIYYPSALMLFFAPMTAVYFAVITGYRRTSKNANAQFFDCYNVDGALRYSVELTETELVVKIKENVQHLPLKALAKVVDAENYSFVLFKTNTILTVKTDEDTKRLIQSLKGIVSVK